MPLTSRDNLLDHLFSAVRLGGADGKTTGEGLRGFLKTLVDELIERTDPLQQLPPLVTDGLRWRGFYDADTGMVTSADPLLDGHPLPPAADIPGAFFIVKGAGTVPDATNSSLDLHPGDWLVSNGATGGYVAVDNTDTVRSVNGRSGAVVLSAADLNLGAVDNTADALKPISQDQRIELDRKQDQVLGNTYARATTATDLTGTDTVLLALGKLEKKADETQTTLIAYTQRPAPDTGTNKVKFDRNAHYARTTTALTAAHFVNATDAGSVAGVTVRLQYSGTTAPVFPNNYRLISGGFIAGRETVLYLTFIPAAVTSTATVAGTAMVEVTISQY